MTNCLFAEGLAGVTAALNIRFRHPVIVNQEAVVRGWIERSSPPLRILRAEVLQGERCKVTAAGKSMDSADSVANTGRVTRLEPMVQ